MKTDIHGRIIADTGITWIKSKELYYSVDPVGYIIEREQTHPLWRLSRKASRTYMADQIIFFSWRVIDCMRVAEIFDITGNSRMRNTGYLG